MICFGRMGFWVFGGGGYGYIQRLLLQSIPVSYIWNRIQREACHAVTQAVDDFIEEATN